LLAKVGQPAPSFTLPSTKGATSPKNLGQEISLSDYQGKWLIFFFYPLDFTFVCPTEIIALSDRLDEFAEYDTDVLGASTDSVHSHFAWLNTPREKNGIAGTRYPLVADYTKDVSRAYGVLDEATGVARPVHHRSRRRSALRGGDRGQRRPVRRRDAARAPGAADRRPVPRGVDARQRAADGRSVAAMPLRTGSPLPDLGGVSHWTNGEPKAEELAGKPLLVHFWSVSCHICHDVAAEVAAWQAEYGPRGLAVVGVHQPRGPQELDVAAVTADALGPMGITWPCAVDNEHALVRRFENQFVPAYYLFDANGKLVHRQAGDRGFERLHAKIEDVLSAKMVAR
jgi:alkyl hydroperoxide reductase subunit AhpC/thiol-disulfide isomerase/thioredoxin